MANRLLGQELGKAGQFATGANGQAGAFAIASPAVPFEFIKGAADYGMDRRPCSSVPLLCLRHVGISAAATLALAVDVGRKPQEAVVNGGGQAYHFVVVGGAHGQ